MWKGRGKGLICIDAPKPGGWARMVSLAFLECCAHVPRTLYAESRQLRQAENQLMTWTILPLDLVTMGVWEL